MAPAVNAVIPISISLFAGLAIYWYFNKNKRRFPKKWEPVGTVRKLFIYPMKGGRRVELENAICTKQGFVMPKNGTKYQFKDRNIICYQEGSLEFCSRPKMQLVEVTACDENYFILSAPGTASLRVKIPDVQDRDKKGNMLFWTKESMSKYDCGDEAAKWISMYVFESTSGYRLGFCHGNFKRNIQEGYKKSLPFYPNLKNDAAGLYSNMSSYMVVSQGSVEDICAKVPNENVTVNNFRPNILVHNDDKVPFVEDNWKWIKIGNVVLYAVRPCLRCNMTLVNPETGISSVSQEPMKTLRKYRKLRDVMNIPYEGLRPVFGNQMGLEFEGQIQLGDTVYVGK